MWIGYHTTEWEVFPRIVEANLLHVPMCERLKTSRHNIPSWHWLLYCALNWLGRCPLFQISQSKTPCCDCTGNWLGVCAASNALKFSEVCIRFSQFPSRFTLTMPEPNVEMNALNVMTIATPHTGTLICWLNENAETKQRFFGFTRLNMWTS